ncbi:MAG TPA: serine/threonine-protein kinase [Polyangiaceae bacterium]|nr:serine/threonine-protein kinase [Polyangiaceae bacterium]
MSQGSEGGGSGASGERLQPGVVVGGKYRLEAPLGQGAMGAVWEATHLGLSESVAIKFIDARYAASPDTRQRFETEARAMAKIRSRFVVSVFDTGRLDDGTLYLVMERLVGETLQAYVKRHGVLSLAEAVEFTCHVGRALGRAHARGVIHRDVKPSNIFLADTPDDGRVAKVLDFGVAKLLRPLEGFSAGQTTAGALLGTPQYMSPEQARGQGGTDHRTDIYSLGLVFYRMFTGTPPRAAGAVGDVIARILTEPLPRPSAARADAPPGLDAWFARTCAADPAARFESVEACIDALVAATGLQGRHIADNLARPSVLVATLDERASASSLPAAGGGSEGGAEISVNSSGAFVAGGSVSTPRRPSQGLVAKGLRVAPAWALGAVSLAVVAAMGATLSRTRGDRDAVADAVGARVDAAPPPPAASEPPPPRPAEAAPSAPAPGPAGQGAVGSSEPGGRSAPVAKGAKARGSARSGAAARAAAAAAGSAPAAASPPPADAVDLGY